MKRLHSVYAIRATPHDARLAIATRHRDEATATARSYHERTGRPCQVIEYAPATPPATIERHGSTPQVRERRGMFARIRRSRPPPRRAGRPAEAARPGEGVSTFGANTNEDNIEWSRNVPPRPTLAERRRITSNCVDLVIRYAQSCNDDQLVALQVYLTRKVEERRPVPERASTTKPGSCQPTKG